MPSQSIPPLPRQTALRLSAPTRPEAERDRLVRVYRSDILPSVGKWDPTNVGNRLIEEERWRTIGGLLERCCQSKLWGKHILEVGCGSGRVLQQLVRMGADAERCVGIDLLPERIAIAREALPSARLFCSNAERLEFGDASFDFVVASTLFSSLWTIDVRIASEMTRVLKPGGAVIYYDLRYDNPRNRHVHGVTRPHLQRLFPDLELELKTVTLVPGVARRLGWLADGIYRSLVSFPVLRTHYTGLLHKRSVVAAG